ncbi:TRANSCRIPTIONAL ACTIVATOR FHA1 [Salix purpurea]|uniref:TRANSCRIPTIONAL ACTIVATOR FHA1 n=1 Tax=Salix purpurea TaxID=77065 RepID=A0A9Q0PFF6_SALPP|nr:TRANSCRIPTIONAL ACTIVATOR FHA1 [Salix purpurea]
MEGRSRIDRDSDNQQLLQLEEKDVVSSVANVLSDLCGPGDWMPMEKLHAELVEQYSSIWHHSRVRRYLTSEDWTGPEAKGKPWYGLLMLLRKYPEHFVINTRSKGRVIHHFDIGTNSGDQCNSIRRGRRDFGVEMWWMARQRYLYPCLTGLDEKTFQKISSEESARV